MQARVQELQSWGHAVEMISRDDIMAREPHVRPTLTRPAILPLMGRRIRRRSSSAAQRAQALGVVRWNSFVGVEIRNGPCHRRPFLRRARCRCRGRCRRVRRCRHRRHGWGPHSDVSQTGDACPHRAIAAAAPDRYSYSSIHLRQQADGRILLGESWSMDTEDTDLSLTRGQQLLAKATAFLPDLAQARRDHEDRSAADAPG